MHPSLKRQIIRHLNAQGEVPPGLEKFVEAINATYLQFDEDRKLLEHTMDIASEELQEKYGRIQQALAEVKATRDALDQASRQQRVILETMADGVLSFDDAGRIHSCNSAAARIFGQPVQTIVGANVNTLIPAYTPGSVAAQEQPAEWQGRRADGQAFPLDWVVSEAYLGDTHLHIGIARDISERKQVEKLKNEFIATVSHELRTPLTAIRGSLGLIGSGRLGELPEPVRAMFTIASNNTERLLMLINDILDIQKMEAGKMVFHLEPVALMPLLEQAISDLSTYATQHGVRFEITQRLEDAVAQADRARLMQVLANLMSNAAKFSRPGSRVEISATRPRAGSLRISVTDFGAGIPEAFKARIFQPFSQSDASDTRTRGGTGLGLTISKAIVEKHGGQLSFVSTEGAGTTFHVDLAEPPTDGGTQPTVRTSSYSAPP